MTIEQLVEMLKNVKAVCESAKHLYCDCYMSHDTSCVIPYFLEIAEALEGLDEK